MISIFIQFDTDTDVFLLHVLRKTEIISQGCFCCSEGSWRRWTIDSFEKRRMADQNSQDVQCLTISVAHNAKLYNCLYVKYVLSLFHCCSFEQSRK
jgi:hypothetical protein